MKSNDQVKLYNTISMAFIALTLICCLITLLWLAVPSTVPGPLVASTDVPLPTVGRSLDTWTPTFTPSATFTPIPSWTPTPPN